MVIRTVYVKLDDAHANPAERARLGAISREQLAAVPGVTGVKVGQPADEGAEAAWDLLLMVHFANIADVAPYAVHPLHVAYLNEVLNPVAVVKKAWNFEVG